MKIINSSERHASERSSQKVQAPDLIKAVYEKVPEHVRKICLESLAEHGITE